MMTSTLPPPIASRIAPRPLLTLSLTAAALLLSLVPGLAEWAAWDREGLLARFELWRLFTGHLTHWTTSHLSWDLLVFLGLGCALERRDRGLLAGTLLLSALLISLTLLVLQPAVDLYRGLSGIDSALFAVWCLTTADTTRRLGDRPLQLAAYGLLGLFGGKIVYEIVTGQTLFVKNTPLFIPLPQSHLAGALAGAALTLVHTQRSAAPVLPLKSRSTPCHPGSFYADPRRSH